MQGRVQGRGRAGCRGAGSAQMFVCLPGNMTEGWKERGSGLRFGFGVWGFCMITGMKGGNQLSFGMEIIIEI